MRRSHPGARIMNGRRLACKVVAVIPRSETTRDLDRGEPVPDGRDPSLCSDDKWVRSAWLRRVIRRIKLQAAGLGKAALEVEQEATAIRRHATRRDHVISEPFAALR